MAEDGAGTGQYDQGLDEPLLAKPNVTEGISVESPGHGYNYGTRPWRDIAFLVVFVLVMLTSFGLGIYAVVNSNPDFYRIDDARYERNGTCIVLGGQSSLPADAKKWAGKLFTNQVLMDSSDDDLFLKTLVYSLLVTLILSLPTVWGLLWLLRNYTKELVYASLPFVVLTPVVLDIAWFVACLTNTACKDIDLAIKITIFVCILLFSGFLLWVIYASRDRIELSIRIIRTASVSLYQNLKLFLVLPALFLGAVVFLIALAVFAFYAYTNGKVVAQPDDHPTGLGTCVWQTKGWVPAYVGLAVLAFYWSSALLHELQSYVISGTVSQWYFAPSNSSTEGAIRRTLGNAFGPSVGTICFAGLVLAIVRMLRSAVRNTRHDRGQEGILAILVRSCLMCILRAVEFVTNFTVCFAAITGEDFCASASRTFDLLKRNALSTLFVESIAGNLLNSVAFVSTALFGAVVFGVVYGFTGLESGASLGTAILCWILLFFIVGLFAQVLSQIIDVVYICYALDKDVGYVCKEEVHDVYVLLPATGANEQPSLAVAQP